MTTLRRNLFIGNLRDTLFSDPIGEAGIGAILQLCSEIQPLGIPHLYLAIEDGDPLPGHVLISGITFVQQQQGTGRSVLIACGAGVSRSATFCVACLKETEGLTLLQAYREVVSIHPNAGLHPILWLSLCEYYGEPFSLSEMVKVYRFFSPNS